MSRGFQMKPPHVGCYGSGVQSANQFRRILSPSRFAKALRGGESEGERDTPELRSGAGAKWSGAGFQPVWAPTAALVGTLAAPAQLSVHFNSQTALSRSQSIGAPNSDSARSQEQPGTVQNFSNARLVTGCLTIPTGLHHSAQGCEERATLGDGRKNPTTPTGLQRRCPRRMHAHVVPPLWLRLRCVASSASFA